MSRSDDENMFSRWSQRKRGVAEEAEAEVLEMAEEVQEPAEDSLDDLTEEEVLEKLGLPNPDTLKAGDDFKPFLKDAVPAYLRKRALRTLWGSNPILANVDGLVDYGDDFTDAAMVPEVLNTVYQVGKGMLRDLLEDDEEEESDSLDPVELTEEPADEDENSENPVLAEADDADHTLEDSLQHQSPIDTGQIDTAFHQPRPRRMRFET